MEEASLSRRKRLAILIASCCLHGGLLFLILRLNHEEITHQDLADQNIPEDLKSQLDYEARILAQSPHEQGATVMLADEPESYAQPDAHMTDPVPDATPIKEQETEQIPENPTTPLDSTPETMPAALPVPQAEQPTSPADITPAQQQQPTATKKPLKKSMGSSGSQAITLAQITQGFLKSMYQERGETPAHELDALTMARQAYTSKVWHILRQSVNAHKRYITLQSNVNSNTVLSMLIRKDGTLLDIKLERPLANRDVEAIEQTIVRAATTTGLYPPIPAQFHADTITLRFPLNIRGHEGMHSYELNYN